MPRAFASATAEQVVAVVEAIVANSAPADQRFVAEFADLKDEHARSALGLAVDLGLLSEDQQAFTLKSPLARLLRTPQEAERAAVIRIVLETFVPFTIFREELEATADASKAATRTRARLDIEAHREDIKATLVDLATFSGALVAGSGGKYERDNKSMSNALAELAAGCGEQAAGVFQVRSQLGDEGANMLSYDNIILPLAAGLRHASGQSGREAVVHVGNAVETFLEWFAGRNNVDLAGAAGLNAKLERLGQASVIPKKLIFVGKYLGHVRNAADHGEDADIQDAWSIQESTGLNYVFVAIAFIRSILGLIQDRHEI